MSITLPGTTGATTGAPALGLWSTRDRGRTLMVRVPHRQSERIADVSVRENSSTVAVHLLGTSAPASDGLVASTRAVPLAAPLGNRRLTMTWNGERVPLLQAVPAGSASATESVTGRAKKELSTLIDSLEPGTPLPSERALSERLDVARMTLRHAVDELTLAGKVSRRRGSGTYVAESKLLCRITPDGQDLAPVGAPARFGQVHVVRDVVAADRSVAAELELATGDLVLHIGRLLLTDHRPVALTTRHIPVARLLETPGAPSAQQWFTERTAQVKARVQLATPDQTEARILDVSQVQPMLSWHRTSRDKHGVPLEHTRLLIRGDRIVLDLPTP